MRWRTNRGISHAFAPCAARSLCGLVRRADKRTPLGGELTCAECRRLSVPEYALPASEARP